MADKTQETGTISKNEKISATTSVCGLIGNPVGHSLSPLIHNSLAEIFGHDLIYTAFCVSGEGLLSAVKGAFELGIKGLNVTVPHKVAVMDSLCDIDPIAEHIGAVNTLVRTKEGFKGYNTDVYGLKRALISEGVTLQDETVVILGAGGASRACAFLCAMEKAGRVYILNRSVDKARALAKDVNDYAGKALCTALALSDRGQITEESFIVLQATSIGLFPDSDKAPVEDATFYERVRFGFDLIYRPAQTKFMKLVNDAGGRSANGLKMLLYQAVEAYELWNGVSVPDESVHEVQKLLEEAVNR